MKFVETCELCKGLGYLPLREGDHRPFPKGDWVECPQCDTKKSMVTFGEKVTPPLIFTGMGMPNNTTRKT